MANQLIEYSYVARSGLESPRNDTASIAELPDGRLIVVWHKYRPGPEGPSDFGLATIASRNSDDGGRTWKNERILVDIKQGDVNVQAPTRRVEMRHDRPGVDGNGAVRTRGAIGAGSWPISLIAGQRRSCSTTTLLRISQRSQRRPRRMPALLRRSK